MSNFKHVLTEDADSILATSIPQNGAKDRIACTKATNGQYNVKTGYHLWHDKNLGTSNVTQSRGWCKIWRLSMPHKVKVLLWRFCRNNLPVHKRLSSKGISLPITCPMCESDIEHLLHLFFDCNFARQCWLYAGGSLDMQFVEYTPDWLLQKICDGNSDEIITIAKVVWGIWFFRNKKVWENKSVNHVTAVDLSTKMFLDWQLATLSWKAVQTGISTTVSASPTRWSPPEHGCFKLNVDASCRSGSAIFSIGLVLRDHSANFVAGKVASFSGKLKPQLQVDVNVAVSYSVC